MAARTKARSRALDILFEADQRGVNVETLLAQRLDDAESRVGNNPYTADLVRGVRQLAQIVVGEQQPR